MKRKLTITMMTTLAQRREAASFAAQTAWASNGNPGAALRTIAERLSEEISRASVLLAAIVEDEIIVLASIRIGPRSLHPLDWRRTVAKHVRRARDSREIVFVQLFRKGEGAVDDRTANRILNAAALAAQKLAPDGVMIVNADKAAQILRRPCQARRPTPAGGTATDWLLIHGNIETVPPRARASAAA